MLALLIPGLGMGGGTASAAQTDITVDLWQDFELDTLDTTNLDAHDHFATTGCWTITDASGKLSTSASGELAFGGTINTEPDTGTRGLVYDCNGGAQAYLAFAHPSQRTQISWGFAFRVTGAGFFSSFGEYDLARNSTDLGVDPSLIKIVDDTNETRFHLFVPSDYSPGIAIQPDTDYWVTGRHVKNDKVVARLYDLATGDQVGAEQELAVSNENLTEFLFGPFVGGPDADSRIHLDDLVLDWTNAAFPLGPPVATEVPDVVGETEANGTTTLEGAGFVVSTSTAYSPTVAAGLIISQDPEGGTFAASGSTVAIVVSLGPQVVAEQPAGSTKRRRYRHIYRIKVDGESFEFASYEKAVEFLEQAKKAAAELADRTLLEAIEAQRESVEIPLPTFKEPAIVVSSRDLRSVVSKTKKEIDAIYARAKRDAEIAMYLEVVSRDQYNEEIIWFM